MATVHFSKVWSAQTAALSARRISVEVDVTKNTLQKFTVVGLPDKAVAESRDRVSAALKNSGFASPKHSNEKVVVSLAPAEIRKEGPIFDLAIAVAYLAACGDITLDPSGALFLGELSLSGDIMPIRGALALALLAARIGITNVFVPKDNAAEAAFVDGVNIYGAETLADVIAHVRTDLDEDGEDGDEGAAPTGAMPFHSTRITRTPRTPLVHTKPDEDVLLDDIVGQETAKRGLAIAAAGRHNIAFFGPPGVGKTMLAKALPAIVPPLSFDECMEVTAIHSIAGVLHESVVTTPPFRAPHHTSSYVSLVGGDTMPRPGEVTLAHRGVLFLDEFPEFGRRVIEALREPLEERMIRISRARGSANFPADFILVAAMNPCPCGNFGSRKPCTCSLARRIRYRERLSGPIIDRIDIWIEVSHVPHDSIIGVRTKQKRSASKRQANVSRGTRGAVSRGETLGSETRVVREAVCRARAIQAKRFSSFPRRITTNSGISAREITEATLLTDAARRALSRAAGALDLSPRTCHRLAKVARTIADLDSSDTVAEAHVMEALQYRPKQDL